MQIYRFDPLQDARWPKLLETHRYASVFHTPAWLEALRRTYGYKPIAFTLSPPTGELKNGLVFCRVCSWITGGRMVSLPFSDHCEPLVDRLEDLDFLIGCLQADMEHQKWKYLEVRPVNGIFTRKGEASGFRNAKVYYLHSLDLRPELDDIFRSLHKDSAQRRIRHAERLNLVSQHGRSEQLLKDFYGLQKLTRRRHHLPPQPYAWFRNLLSCMGSALEIRLAYKDRVPVAGVLTLRFRNTLYYKYGVSDARLKNMGAMPFLLWDTIRDAKKAGLEEFDLGRSESDNEGLIAFKDHWTHIHRQISYWRYPASDSLASSEDWKLRIAKRIFTLMPDRVLDATGRLIYRHIG